MKILLFLFLFCISIFAEFQIGDKAIYSRYFIMITGIENIKLFNILNIHNKIATISDVHSKAKINTHISSLQPIFELDNIFNDRTLKKFTKAYNISKIKTVGIESMDVFGHFDDSTDYTGQRYKLFVITETEQAESLIIIDTFHFFNKIQIFGLNDGKPDFFELKGDFINKKDSSFPEYSILYEIFLKIDALKLLKDERLKYEMRR